MPSLADYQQAMQTYLSGGQRSSQSLAGCFLGDRPAIEARLAIYHGTAHWTLVNALRLSYPAVRQVLGAEFFESVAGDFVREAPPISASLNDYGAAFAPFVARVSTTSHLIYLQDLARLEWAVNRALHAADTDGLDPTRLRALEPRVLAHVRFRAHPSVSVLSLRYPADRIWQAVLERDDAAMRSVDLSSGAGWVLVERDAQSSVQVRRVTEAVGRLSAGLIAGLPLHEALAVGDEFAHEPERLQAALTDHLASGRLVDFDFQNPPEILFVEERSS